MDFVTSHLRKMSLWPVEHFSTYLSLLLGRSAGCNSKPTQKYVEKVFNWSEVHLSEMTRYKIHTLSNKKSKGKREKSLKKIVKKPSYLGIITGSEMNSLNFCRISWLSWSNNWVIFCTGNSGANQAWRIFGGFSVFERLNFAGFLSEAVVDKILFAT